jgi:ABC-type transporter Mla maintaining outer membrane lipid asymmetry ATPase subunit MlaF
MADIFQRGAQSIQSPITADKCTITIDGNVVADAIQFQCSYQQAITRRRSIGNQTAIIYGGIPQGTITIARLITDGSITSLGSGIFSCKGGTVSFSGQNACDGGGSVNYTAKGCMVSAFSISANADDLTVMDNVVIEFIELSDS